MIWTQLVYGTIVLTNLNVGTPQFYTGPSRDIRAADLVEIYEAAQERCAATNRAAFYDYTARFTTNQVTNVAYSVEEEDFGPSWPEMTQTVYSAGFGTFTVWPFSLVGGPTFYNQIGLDPPIQNWRISRRLLNRTVNKINDCARFYVATNDPLSFYTTNSLWAAAGSTNGAPWFGLFIQTAHVWQVYRALSLLDKTWVVYTNTVGQTLATNFIDDAVYYHADGAPPAWWEIPADLPDGYDAPVVAAESVEHADVPGNIAGETIFAYGPDVLRFRDPGIGHDYTLEIDGASNASVITHSSSGIVYFAELAGGVTCSGRLLQAVSVFRKQYQGTNELLLNAVSTGDWWSVTHSGPSTNWAGIGTWNKSPRIADYVDPSTFTATGGWEAVAGHVSYADPVARVELSLTIQPATSVVFWTFTRCTNWPGM